MDIQAVFFDMGGTIETFWYTPELRLRATPELRRMLNHAGLDLGINDQELCDVINSGWERYHKESIETMQEQSPSKVWSEYIFPEFHLDLEKLSNISEALMVALELNFFRREMRPEVPGGPGEDPINGYANGSDQQRLQSRPGAAEPEDLWIVGLFQSPGPIQPVWEKET